jgi:hypothetical protein
MIASVERPKQRGTEMSSRAQTKISLPALKVKLEAMSMASLLIASVSISMDPQIKKHINREIDDRASRGTSRGFGMRYSDHEQRKIDAASGKQLAAPRDACPGNQPKTENHNG